MFFHVRLSVAIRVETNGFPAARAQSVSPGFLPGHVPD
jgi:hypothetical protein